jgi:hypothetical protein
VESNDGRIRISLEDVASQPQPAAIPEVASATGRSYGNIQSAVQELALPEERGSIWMRGWFYLGFAGFFGAFLAWGICEPFFVDGGGQAQRWGNIALVPLVVALICIGFSISESVVERSAQKAITRGLLSVPLSIILGFVFYFIANLIFALSIGLVHAMGVQSNRSPGFWVARGIAWMAFGAASGVVYGIVGQSGKRTLYGVLGGILGAGLGGILFDPIDMLAGNAALSRCIGFALFGLCTGVGVGLVESALKDRWLYVTSGPLAGKQFILYKPRTVMGSEQTSDIYLFKDKEILPQHVMLEMVGPRVQLRALGVCYVNGQPVHQRVLESGAMVQIGRYAFRYQERQRS